MTALTSSTPPFGGRPRRIAPLVTLGAAMAALSATGAPNPKVLEWLVAAGAPAGTGGLILHLAPIVLALVCWPTMQALARGRSQPVRSTVYGLTGVVIGFFTAFCLDIFVGVEPALERLTGPLGEAGDIDIVAWALSGYSLFCGALMLAIAAIGTPAARAVALEEADPECTEVRRRDRATFAFSGAGLLGQGVFVGAFAVASQLDVEAAGVRLGVAGAVAAGALAFAWGSWSLWRRFDEMQRRATVEAYAWSGFAAWLVCMIWAVLESLSLAPSLSAYGAIVGLVVLQNIAAAIVSAQTTMAPARRLVLGA